MRKERWKKIKKEIKTGEREEGADLKKKTDFKIIQRESIAVESRNCYLCGCCGVLFIAASKCATSKHQNHPQVMLE